jgi:hypothetical protein
MKTGTHRVEVVKEGFEPWSGTVTVSSGKRARLDARLRRVVVAAAPTPPPSDEVDVNRIYVNSPAEVDVPALRANLRDPKWISKSSWRNSKNAAKNL